MKLIAYLPAHSFVRNPARLNHSGFVAYLNTADLSKSLLSVLHVDTREYTILATKEDEIKGLILAHFWKVGVTPPSAKAIELWKNGTSDVPERRIDLTL